MVYMPTMFFLYVYLAVFIIGFVVGYLFAKEAL
jgi:hypothetical protein